MADSVTAAARETRPAHPILEHDATSEWLGIDVVSLGDGTAVTTMELRPEMLNGFAIAHGGMVFAFADTTFALACNPGGAESLAEMESITVAAGADINFISSARAGDKLRAEASRRAAAGRSGVYDIEVTAESPDGSTRVIAEFRGRSRTIPNPARRN
ncbi:hotdog fold thioesterase [Arthrobacter sp. zg-Y916]|uniref:Hotdog fold thioesterase n=1 Tax=Arthrobacter caoxuetaonis TaxID=2886935 RepID=A0A9X1MCC3_9MICC|nr:MULTISPECIES: hotdog fold thioesterase [Arthrobacter]MCC3296407.1 hotdog fold thioesterase [Arthrobacter caoxuetaonis]MCC9192483.1 hotdog fold thioesterase [Arthrobacter sp. zg-Y916]USQ56752.1 hotdog fold thioesterase [Arthrobacter caoxuetaonis]